MLLLLLGCARAPVGFDGPESQDCVLRTADAMFALVCPDRTLAVGEAPGGLDAARVELGGVRAWEEHPPPDRHGVARYAAAEGSMQLGARVWAQSPARGRWALCAAPDDTWEARCAPLLDALTGGWLPDLRPHLDPPYTPPRWGELPLELPPGCWVEPDPRGVRLVCGLDALFVFHVADRFTPELLGASLSGGTLRACSVGGLPALCSLSRAVAEGPSPARVGATQELADGRVWGLACTWLDEGGPLPPVCAQLVSLEGAP